MAASMIPNSGDRFSEKIMLTKSQQGAVLSNRSTN